MNTTEEKILYAISKGSLKLIPGKKSWYTYNLNIQELIWARNLRDGYDIHVYDRQGFHLITVSI